MSIEPKQLQDQLEEMREEHRRRHLSSELDDIAETMEVTILQQTLAKVFFEEDIEIDPQAKERVREVMTLLDRKEYEAVEERLDSLKRDVESAETTVENRIQELRLKDNSTVAAMRRLNDRVNRVDGVRLQALEGLLNDWRWKEHVYLDEDVDLEELEENAREYGEDMQTVFDQLRDEMFGVYPDEIRDLIHRMIDDERLSYADLTSNQREKLAESDVGEYIELTLS